MECRKECGACCIAASISSPIPGENGMSYGKPAGTPCVHLTDLYTCAIYPFRPWVCRDFAPSIEYCGSNRDEALKILEYMEIMTVIK